MKNPDDRGTILVTSLWIMAILSMLAIGIGFRISIEGRLARYNMDRIKALYLAKAGLVKSQAVLAQHGGTDTIYACGVTLNINKNETPESVFSNIALGEGSFSVGYADNGAKRAGMSDEERKININKVGAVNTGTTPLPKGALEDLLSGYSNKTDIADAILAWRKPKTGMDLEIDSDYESLGYERKGGDFSCIEELLLVDGVTPEIYDSIKDQITVYGDGQININTASERVLRAIFSAAKLSSLSDAPENIAARISGSLNNLKGERWANDALPFTEIDTALRNSGVSDIDRPLVINYFTTSSNYFRIESEGKVARSGIKKKVVAVIDRRKSGDNRLLYYREY